MPSYPWKRHCSRVGLLVSLADNFLIIFQRERAREKQEILKHFKIATHQCKCSIRKEKAFVESVKMFLCKRIQPLQKLLCFTIYASLLLVSSSPELLNTTATQTSSGNDIHKLSPKLVFEIRIHGILLWTSMGFLMPIGILIIRKSNREECGKKLKILFYLHSISQMLSVLLVTAGAVMSIKNFNNAFNNNHQRLGLALYGIVWLQALSGLLRPHRGSKGRSVWFFWHWMLGTAVSLLGIINVYTGLEAYHQKTSKSIRAWGIVFITEVCLIVLFYLLQDKWGYMQKQRAILGSE